MSLNLEGKTALVTGGARGLGRGIALYLATIGADIAINDINLNSAKEYNEKLSACSVAEEIKNLGCRTLNIQADITKRDQVEKMIQNVLNLCMAFTETS